MVYVEGSVALQGEDIQFEKEGRGQAGLNAARSQKTSDNSRKRKARNAKSQSLPQTIGPPASIGAAPAFIEGEEGEQAWLAEEDEPEVLEEEKETKEVQHFEDPLTEALFGGAPDIQISQALTRPDPVKAESNESDENDENDEMAAKDESKGRPRKKRSRRNNDRKRRKRSPEEAKGNEDDSQGQSEPSPDEAKTANAASEPGDEQGATAKSAAKNEPDIDLNTLKKEDVTPAASQEATTAS
jgi:hypothetical protein